MYCRTGPGAAQRLKHRPLSPSVTGRTEKEGNTTGFVNTNIKTNGVPSCPSVKPSLPVLLPSQDFAPQAQNTFPAVP